MSDTRRMRLHLHLLPDTLALLDAAAEAAGVSRNAMAETLIRHFGARADRLPAFAFPADARGRRGAGRRKKSGKI